MKEMTISSWLNFGRHCAPGKGVCGGAKIFGSALLRLPARSVCVSPSAFSLVRSFNAGSKASKTEKQTEGEGGKEGRKAMREGGRKRERREREWGIML